MRRKGNLIQFAADPDILRMAFYLAQRGKSGKWDVRKFRAHLNQNLALLRSQLLHAQLDVGHYESFMVYEPKERKILAASFPERVLHHALMAVCQARFEQHFIFDSYACRKFKGTHAAIRRATDFNHKFAWYLKLDFRKYFDSIPHDYLKNKLGKLFKDPLLMKCFKSIIDSYQLEPGFGLPIGNLTSQYFANYYLSSLDHYIKETLRIKGYVRYMDDMVLWSNDKETLKAALLGIQSFVDGNLKLTLKPFALNKTALGLNFLGHRLIKNKIELNKTSKKRFSKRLRQLNFWLETDLISESAAQRNAVAAIAFTRVSESKSFRKRLIEKIGEQV